jgi:hypothetical protein
MRWELAPRLRCDVVAFSGLNLSGERRVVEVHPVGGRKGDLVPADLRSLAFVAPVGTRLVLATSEDPDDWEAHPWRAVVVLAGQHDTTREGRAVVRVPDLDWLDAFDARRTDPDFQATFDEATTLAEGRGWTFGRGGVLKGMIRQLRVDRLPA